MNRKPDNIFQESNKTGSLLNRATAGFFLLSFAVFILSSCSGSRFTLTDYHYLQGEDFSFEKIVSSKVYSPTDSSLDLYFNLDLRSLEPGPPPKNPLPLDRNLCFRYYLYHKDKLADSSFQWIKSDPSHRKRVQLEFRNIKSNAREFLLRTELYDFYSNRRYFNSERINLNNTQLMDKFLLLHLPDSTICTENYFRYGDSILIRYRDKSISFLDMQYSAIMSKPAAPPWYMGDMVTKTPIASFRHSGTVRNAGVIHFESKGNYLVKAATGLQEGLWLNCFGKEYPYAYMPEEFAAPLIYLCSRDEFAEIIQAADQKLASAEFWKKSIGDEKRAETMSNIYYQRVEQANSNFSTSREGWKTDRGMIYLVFGKPALIYTNTWGETWSYPERQGLYPAASFRFSRTIYPGGEELTLLRDDSFRSIWNLATEAWRNGRMK